MTARKSFWKIYYVDHFYLLYCMVFAIPLPHPLPEDPSSFTLGVGANNAQHKTTSWLLLQNLFHVPPAFSLQRRSLHGVCITTTSVNTTFHLRIVAKYLSYRGKKHFYFLVSQEKNRSKIKQYQEENKSPPLPPASPPCTIIWSSKVTPTPRLTVFVDFN